MLEFTRDTIFDVVTCNPFTIRGRESVERLKLHNSVTRESFFGGKMRLFVHSKYIESPTAKPHQAISDDIPEFSSNFKALREHSSIHYKLIDFESKFFDDVDDLLYILGSSGSGKSVYLHYLLWQRRQRCEESYNDIFLNLEVLRTEITYARMTFRPPEESASWLFCLHLLDTLCYRMTKVAENKEMAQKIIDCFDATFGNKEVSDYLDNIYHKIMDGFREYVSISDPGDSLPIMGKIVKGLYGLIDFGNYDISVKQVLRALAVFAFCDASAQRKRMTIISVDNIEKYIKIRENKTTEIFDKDIRSISNAFSGAREDLILFFENCGIVYKKHFKVIIAMRNSSVKTWHSTLQTARTVYQHSVEISGWFDYHEIVDVKMKKVLGLIKGKNPIEVMRYMDLFNMIRNDEKNKGKGNSFVEMGLEMFNNSIRRTTASFSAITFELHSILYSSESIKSIGIDDYNEYWHNKNSPICRFLLRRALLEQIFRFIVSRSNWKNMLLDSDDPIMMSLLQRILLFLARRTEKYYNISLENYIPLHSLICGVFVSPNRDIKDVELEYEDHFLPLARILFALNQPLYSDTSWTPLCVITLNVDLSNDPTPVVTIAELMMGMWNEVKSGKVVVNGTSDEYRSHLSIERGIRLTRAGFFFIHHISDYSFYMSNLGSDHIPLLYNTDHEQVMSLMNRAIEKARKTIGLLNEFDRGFFGDDLGLRSKPVDSYLGGYMFLYDGTREESIQQRIVYFHHMFLTHYKRFLDHFGERAFRNPAHREMVSARVGELIGEYEELFEREKGEGRISEGSRLFRI